jgi:teichuronic acid biosynthesis glycosyltransferase TuaC
VSELASEPIRDAVASAAEPAAARGGARRLRVLAVTQLFPNSETPMLAVYNRLQFTALAELCDLDVRAVIPWFPGARLVARWSVAGRCVAIPAEEDLDGLRVRHPRFLMLPKLGASISPALYAASLWPEVRALKGSVDVVLGCWAMPDGVAAVMLARLLGAAAVVKVHGSDLNVAPNNKLVGQVMRWVLPRADRLIAVSRPLAEKAMALGVPAERVVQVRNGLNRDVFKVRDRAEARSRLGLAPQGRWILYVGTLDRTKGVVDLIEAFTRLAPEHPDLHLALVGQGPEDGRCRALASRYPGRVAVPGVLALPDVAQWMAACDILTLPSWNEGTPNVILEALASGRRVVATSVGGIPDILTSTALGEMVPAQNVPALAEALSRGAYTPYDPAALTSAAPYGWRENAARVLEVLQAAAAERALAR